MNTGSKLKTGNSLVSDQLTICVQTGQIQVAVASLEEACQQNIIEYHCPWEEYVTLCNIVKKRGGWSLAEAEAGWSLGLKFTVLIWRSCYIIRR